MNNRLLTLVFIVLALVSCQKQEAEDYYFHRVESRFWEIDEWSDHKEYYQGEPRVKEGYLPGSYFLSYKPMSDVTFTPITDSKSSEKLLYFDFGYDGCCKWVIASSAIEDGVKYYWDTDNPPAELSSDLKIGSFWWHWDDDLLPVLYKSVDTRDNSEKGLSGWVSFTRRTDDPKIILRVNYEFFSERLYLVPIEDDKFPSFPYRCEGMLEFTNKMKINGIEYIQ